MTALENAANEAAEALKHSDRKDRGLVIFKTAEQYGVDTSALARELSARRRPKEERMGTSVWLDMDKVKALGCGGDLGKLARYCHLGHDTLRIAEGRDGKGVQRRTAERIAQKFGKNVEDLLHSEDKQWRLPTPEDLTPEPLPGFQEKEIPAEIIKEDTKSVLLDENGISFFAGKPYTITLNKEEERMLKMVAAFNNLTEAGTVSKIVKRFLNDFITDQTQPLANMKL